jgi:hypothetical protein
MPTLFVNLGPTTAGFMVNNFQAPFLQVNNIEGTDTKKKIIDMIIEEINSETGNKLPDKNKKELESSSVFRHIDSGMMWSNQDETWSDAAKQFKFNPNHDQRFSLDIIPAELLNLTKGQDPMNNDLTQFSKLLSPGEGSEPKNNSSLGLEEPSGNLKVNVVKETIKTSIVGQGEPVIIEKSFNTGLPGAFAWEPTCFIDYGSINDASLKGKIKSLVEGLIKYMRHDGRPIVLSDTDNNSVMRVNILVDSDEPNIQEDKLNINIHCGVSESNCLNENVQIMSLSSIEGSTDEKNISSNVYELVNDNKVKVHVTEKTLLNQIDTKIDTDSSLRRNMASVSDISDMPSGSNLSSIDLSVKSIENRNENMCNPTTTLAVLENATFSLLALLHKTAGSKYPGISVSVPRINLGNPALNLVPISKLWYSS